MEAEMFRKGREEVGTILWAVEEEITAKRVLEPGKKQRIQMGL